jgi:HK97 family phage major capsid protein
VWLLNDATVKAVRKLKDAQGQYLWQPSLVAGTPDTILGRPVKTSAYMPTIAAAAKSVAFGDFGYYWIADRQGRSFKRLGELYARERSGRFPRLPARRRQAHPARSHQAACAEGVLNQGGEDV